MPILICVMIFLCLPFTRFLNLISSCSDSKTMALSLLTSRLTIKVFKLYSFPPSAPPTALLLDKVILIPEELNTEQLKKKLVEDWRKIMKWQMDVFSIALVICPSIAYSLKS